jgi:hypothetical protein
MRSGHRYNSYLFVDGDRPVAEADPFAETLRSPSPRLAVGQSDVVAVGVMELKGAVCAKRVKISYPSCTHTKSQQKFSDIPGAHSTQ